MRIIRVFDSQPFYPTGIRIEDVKDDCDTPIGSKIIFGMYSTRNPYYNNRTHPMPEFITEYNCIFIKNKTSIEIMDEINKQLRIIENENNDDTQPSR